MPGPCPFSEQRDQFILQAWHAPTAREDAKGLENRDASQNSPMSQPTPNVVAVSMANTSEENLALATEPSPEISCLLGLALWPFCTGYTKQPPLSLELPVSFPLPLTNAPGTWGIRSM